MTSGPDLDRRLAALLDAQAEPHAPDGLLGDTLRVTSRTRRRPAWRIPERWIPMPLTMRLAVVPRSVLLLITLLLVAALAAGAVAVGSALRLDRTNGGSRFALPPTACPAGTTLKSGDIATIAGSGQRGKAGAGGPALAANMDLVPQGGGDVAVDPTGVMKVSDPGNRRLLRVGTDGILDVVPDPTAGPRLIFPLGLAFDPAGSDVIIADPATSRRPGSGSSTPVARRRSASLAPVSRARPATRGPPPRLRSRPR